MRGSVGADERALVERGQPAVGEMLALESRQPAGMREHHVGGQLLRLAAEAVGQPRPERRAPADDAAVVHRIERLLMIVHAGVHGADERDVVGHFAELRQQLAQLHAALAVRRKFPRRAKDLRRSLREVVVFDLAGKLLPIILREHRLRIEEIHLRRPAHHEQRDHRLRLRLKVRRLREQIVARRAVDMRLHRRREQAVLLQQPGEREASRGRRSSPARKWRREQRCEWFIRRKESGSS